MHNAQAMAKLNQERAMQNWRPIATAQKWFNAPVAEDHDCLFWSTLAMMRLLTVSLKRSERSLPWGSPRRTNNDQTTDHDFKCGGRGAFFGPCRQRGLRSRGYFDNWGHLSDHWGHLSGHWRGGVTNDRGVR